MADASRSERTVLAGSTVGGAGTTVALRAALEIPAPADGVALIPRQFFGDARRAGWAPVASGRAVGLVREALGWPRADRWIGFCDRLPLRTPRHSVLVVQNAHLYEPSLGPGWGLAQRLRLTLLRAWAHRSARLAHRIVCSTESSADDVASITGVSRREIVVAPIPAKDPGVRKTQHEPSIRRILLVGDVYAHKRWPVAVDAIAAFARELDRDLTLVHLGAAQEQAADQAMLASFERAGAAGVIVESRGRVDHEVVLAEMVRADVMVFPSSIESQGLPLVEALAVGVPLVASDIGPFRDLGGDAVELVAVDEGAAGITRALRRLDPAPARAELAARGEQRWPVGTGWDLLRYLDGGAPSNPSSG